MKKLQIWSMMMLISMALPLMVACGGDDDGDNRNSGNNNKTTEVAITGQVTSLGVSYACIDGFVNLNMITSSYSSPKIGIEYSTSEDFKI